MGRVRVGVFACIVVLILATVTACTWDDVEAALSFHPQEGETYHVRMTTDQDITQTIQGTEVTAHQMIGFGFSITTTEVEENGDAWCDYVYEWIVIDMDLGGWRLTYNSEKPEESTFPNPEGMGLLMGKGFSMKFNAAGEMLEVAGIDELLQGMMDDAGIVDAAERAQFEELMKGFLNEDELRKAVGQTVINFPEGEVKRGDTWTSTRTAELMGTSMIIDDVWELKGYKDDLATVDFVSTVEMKPGAGGGESSPFEVSLDLSGEQKGSYRIDVSTGMCVEGKVTQSFSGQAVDVSSGVEYLIPMSIEATTIIEMSKAQD